MRKITLALSLSCCFALAQSAQLEAVKIISKNQSMPSSGVQGSTKYSKDSLEAFGNKDMSISNIIKKNPNARLNRGERNSKNSGEILPENVSINGALNYQNNFSLDGININNDINPLGGILSTGSAANAEPFFTNPSQGLNINTDLLENIELIDSFASARYGNFQGGVINAKTRDPKQNFSGKIYYGYTADNLQKVIIDESQKEDYEYSDSSSYQPEFKKHSGGVSLEGHVNENLGFMFDYNKIYSSILQRKYMPKYDLDESKKSEKHNLHRINENFFLKALYAKDGLKITPSILYAPYSATYYSNGGYDAKADIKGGGLNFALGLDKEFNKALFKSNLAYNTLKTNRETTSDRMLVWWKTKQKTGYSPSKTVSVVEGIGGDVKQEQNNLIYNASVDLKPMELLNSFHQFSLGFEVQKTKVKYDISKPYNRAVSSKELKGTCQAGDIFCNSEEVIPNIITKNKAWKGQYFDKYYRYEGKSDFDYFQSSFFIEDSIRIKNLLLRPGIRFDKNDYMGGANIAPRFMANLDIFGDDKTNIFAGYNRYYGRNILAYKLREKMGALQSEYKRKDQNSPWEFVKTNPNAYKFDSLDVPYDDEFGIGISQKVGDFELGAKYLKRKGKDLIRRSKAKTFGLKEGDGKTLAKNYGIYTNEGKSESDIYTLSVNSINDFDFAGLSHGFGLNFNYTKSDRNFNDYSDMFDDVPTNKSKVIYNGKLINENELPQNTNNTPWNINASLVTKLNRNFSISNFVNVQGGYEALLKDAKQNIGDQTYRAFKSQKLGTSLSWDIKIAYEVSFWDKHTFFAHVDVTNLTNRKNTALLDDSGVVRTYDAGRQIWLKAGYTW